MHFCLFVCSILYTQAQPTEGKGAFIHKLTPEVEAWYDRQPNEQAWLYRGKYFTSKALYRQALDCFNRALLLNPQYAEAYLARAQSKEAMGDISGAINDYNMCLYFLPRASKAHISRAFIRLKVGDKTGACQDWHCLPSTLQPLNKLLYTLCSSVNP